MQVALDEFFPEQFAFLTVFDALWVFLGPIGNYDISVHEVQLYTL